MITEGSFREDLWYRISIYPIRIPPLRERTQDIPELISYFALKSAEKLGIPPTLVCEEDLALLSKYRWPGNIREFSAVIERAVILGMGKKLNIKAALNIPADIFTPPLFDNCGRFLTYEEMAAQHIKNALKQCKGKISGEKGAAKLLGLNTSTLRGKMRKYRIEP